ncbi:MAG: hypothetical protein COA50_05965 [Flavobacteriaceae bacterium]|nr:MAG: hypothetical protein COA50_05965 [Flavobacteriaceae bacterium]
MKELKTYPNINHFNPSDCISGKIMRCNRIVANVFRKHLMQFNITNSQLSIVFVIAKVENCNQKKISEVLYLEKSTVNRNITRLLAHKIITYTDRKNLMLTTEGKQLLNTVIPFWEKAMTEIRAILEDEGANALNALHKQLTH